MSQISGIGAGFSGGFQPKGTQPVESGTGFTQALSDAVGAVDSLHADASSKISALLKGDGQDIHSAMIAAERADLAFELVIQVRNKVINAYQEVAHLQF